MSRSDAIDIIPMFSQYTTLIQPDELVALQANAPERLVVCDCTFDLADHAAGQRAYEAGHIPGAYWLHLETVMSGVKTGRNGRHPLPNRDDFAAYMGAIGAAANSQIVAYDAGNAMFAARLWWLMRWLGHENVAVLDGGLAAWRNAGQPLETIAPPARHGSFKARAPLVSTVDYAGLRHATGRMIIDARAPDRFRGENEILDAAGGHIPGAKNHFFKDNLTPDGHFKPQAALRAAYSGILAGRSVDEVVLSCGSGVTACHNLLAMEIAGLLGAALYPGSWSEWSAQPDTLIEKG